MNNLSDRQICAKKYFNNGFNCAQSVMVAFADLTSLSIDQVLCIATPLGGGFARKRGDCGAIVGASICYSLIQNKTTATNPNKNSIYQVTHEMIQDFVSRNHSIICKTLLESLDNIDTSPTPAERTAEYYQKRPCLNLVLDAVQILENTLKKDNLL